MLPIHKPGSYGSVILRGVLGDDATNALRIIARRSHLPWTAEDPTSPNMHRNFAKVPSVPADLLSLILERYFRTFSPDVNLTAIEWCFLKTYAGAPDEPTRRNFMVPMYTVNPMDATSLPGSLLIATQDDTVVYGYGWNHHVAFQSNQVVIQLRKGDILFMRGDFIHARAGYAWNNLCVQTFLGCLYTRPCFHGQLVPRYDDKPSVATYDFPCYVWGCRYVGKTTRALSKHLSSFHNFVTQSPRRRDPSYDPRVSAEEAEIVDLTWPADN